MLLSIPPAGEGTLSPRFGWRVGLNGFGAEVG